MKNLPRSFSYVFFCAMGTSICHAQSSLHDPFRPPNAFISNGNSENISATNGSSIPKDDSTTSGVELKMLLIGQKRSYALIEGRLLKPGDSINQWKLVSIGNQSVVMRNASMTEKISINPSVVKTIRVSKKSGKSVDSIDKKTSRSSP